MYSQKLGKDIVITPNNSPITHVTIVGKLIISQPEDRMKLTRLAWSFKRVIEFMVREIISNRGVQEAVKRHHNVLPNYVYLESAYKHAKLIVEGCKRNNGNPRHVHVRKLFVISRGNRFDKGNRNIKLVPKGKFFEVHIKYPWGNSWLVCKAVFGEKYVPLLKELVILTERRVESYEAKIVFRRKRIELHVSIPLQLYLKYFSKTKPKGYGLLAGFDLNSDRINMVVIDENGRIITLRTEWFPEVTLHGYSRHKAKNTRLKALKKLLLHARRIGVDYVVFENLLTVKKNRRKRKLRSPHANRKKGKFAKKQLIIHGILMSLKLGLTPILINPKGTTHSKEHGEAMKRRGLDKHMASAYIIAYRDLKIIRNNEK